jgi:hypothetical protein
LLGTTHLTTDREGLRVMATASCLIHLELMLAGSLSM